MTLGIDIDDTLTETSETANKYLKKYDKYKHLEDYHLLDNKTFKNFMKANLKAIQESVPLKDGAKEFIDYARSIGHKVVIITARGSKSYEFLIPLTDKYFEINDLVVDEIKYRQEVKGKACLDLGVDLFIDDKETVLNEVKEKGIKTIRFCSKTEKSKHEKISNWQEAYKFLEEKEG